MKKSRDYFALDWIKGELDQTLAAARQSLEEFAQPEHDKTRMRACLTHLHQVHGTLVMLELTGVAVLADEMERLAQALLNGEVANVEAAQQILMQGILQLPAFLEEIQKGFPDSRRAVLPIANELRLARGDTAFSDTPTAGGVDLRATAAEDTLARFKDIDGVDKARKIRAAYQQVLLAILRGDYGPKVVGTLTKVAVGLERICEKTPLAALWRAFGVFVKSLAGEARLPGDVVKLLRRVDAEIKVLARDGRSALARPLSTELVRSLVDAAAARGFESAELEDLGRALTVAGGGTPAAQPSGIAGNQALQTAASALREEIASVKDQLDLFVRGDQLTVDQLRQLVAPLKRIGSTLSVLGFESSRAIVVDQVEAVNGIAADGRIDEAVLMGVAAALLQVDENLMAVTERRRRPLGGKEEPSALLDEAQLAVLAEARNGLEHVKQAIVEYVSSHWDTNKLSDVPGLLGAVRGALTMVTLTRPADLLGRCTGFVERELLTGKVPDWTTLDTFADAISGIDYYLERLCEQTSPGDDIVTRVERSVVALESARPQESSSNKYAEAQPERDAPARSFVSTEVPTLTDGAAQVGRVDDDTAWDETDDVRPAQTPPSGTPATVEDTESFELVIEEAAEQGPARRAPAELEFDLSSELFDDVAEEVPMLRASPRPEVPRPEVPRPETPTRAAPLLLRAVPKPTTPATTEPAMPERSGTDIAARKPPQVIEPRVTQHEVTQKAPQRPAPPIARPPPPSIEEPDEEIIEIFVEEMGEVLESLDVALAAWSADLGDTPALKGARRGFHTLKGSGRIVGAKLIGELAWSIENLLNRVIDGTLPARPQIADLALEVRQVMPGLKDAFRARTAFDESIVAHICERADLLASGGQIEDLAEPEIEVPPAAQPVVEELAQLFVEEPVEEPAQPLVDAIEAQVEEHAATPREEAQDAIFDEARELFVREFRQHFDTIEATREREPTGEALARALHTLRGSAAMAGVSAIDRLVSPLYAAVLGAIEHGAKDHRELRALLAKGAGVLRLAVAALERGDEANADAARELDAQSNRLVAHFAEAAPPATPLVALEGAGVLVEAREFLKSWAEGAMDLSTLADIVAALHEVRNQAESQRQLGVVHLCDALVSAHERLEDHPLSPTAFDALDAAHELLLTMFDRIAANQAVPSHTRVVETLERAGVVAPLDEEDIDDFDNRPRSARLIEFPTTPVETPPPVPQPPSNLQAPKAPTVQVPKAEPVAPIEPSRPMVEPERRATPPTGDVVPPIAARRTERSQPRAEATPARADTTQPPRAAIAPALPADVDPEILEIFFEESDELLETIDQSIHEWVIERDNQVHVENLLRALHTLKGGARLAGLSSLGDETHAFESFLSRAQSGAQQNDAFFRALQKAYDDLASHVSRIRQAAGLGAVAQPVPNVVLGPPVAKQPIVANETAAVNEAPKAPPSRAVEPTRTVGREAPPETSKRELAAREAVTASAERAPEREEAPAVAARTSPDGREMVRVSAGLLEQLVNLAGESSIVRSRIEQGISDFAIALEEMETTIERVREQLRRLEIETETQVLFRHERHVGPQYEEFDPLEMDRYSHLQQLSKALSESASDMLDLKETLSFKSRESETLLIQQARINTELQEGLMRTRMVPFSRLVPRLRRIVRQVGNEVGKEVELHVYNAEGELDRNVLERMVPPLEHMLRNAIDHGIEVAELRRNFGKTDSGRVDLRLSREAGDVMIEIADDGAGIDVESVRAKAVERGLMAQDARLSDDEVLQFVFAPGFSTAKLVTQISGRGVGMDVVHSTVKQLGGSIQITSVPGKGTRFTVRLPFTVSVNRALMVSVNEDLYAVPLNTIEGIVRITADQLEQMYSPSGGGFEYAGVPYRVRYLGSYIGREYKPRPEQGSVPVVLLRSGDIAMAIHVDGVAGSREIVVKSLGPQFAGVSGISGATILGDGSVVVILDLLALVRAQMPAHHHVLPPLSEKRDRPRCVMVVDDSVTVRKVTSRLLERQGMEVMVAKDGVEAIAMLQERRPDILLLDIEMPRMDGFEVARQIRHDERLAKLPIVMISSRTGAKHQEHAVELGVNRFLGKPFQESDLLATIDELVD